MFSSKKKNNSDEITVNKKYKHLPNTAAAAATASVVAGDNDNDDGDGGGVEETPSKRFKKDIYFNETNRLENVSLTSHGSLLEKLPLELLLYIDSNKTSRFNMHKTYIKGSTSKKTPGFIYTTLFNIGTISTWPTAIKCVFNNLNNISFRHESLIPSKSNFECIDYSSPDTDTTPTTTTTIPQSSTPLLQQSTCTREQIEFIDKIQDTYENNLQIGETKLFLLTGSPGSGKTFIIGEMMRRFENIMKILYLAPTKCLQFDVKKKFNVKSRTIFAFIMCTLRLTFNSLCILNEHLSYLEDNIFINQDFHLNLFDIIGCDFGHWMGNSFIIMIDEISMKPIGELSFIIHVIQKLAEYFNYKIIIILTGDFNQIPPLFTASINFESVLQMITYQSNFQIQRRMDPNYFSIIQNIQMNYKGSNCYNYLREEFENVFDKRIDYDFPIDIIFNKHCEYKNLQQLIEWFKTNDIAKKILNFFAFSFSNSELHYNNLMLALMIYSQLNEYSKKSNGLFNLEDYIQFITYKVLENDDYKNDDLRPFDIEKNDSKIPILPLIRYMPYKYLGTNSNIPRSSILYLIDWKPEQLIMYFEADDKILYINKSRFMNNLFKNNNTLFGYPIQLAYANTFHSSQGLTLEGQLCINLNNISKEELFVVMSRIKQKNGIKNLTI